VELHTLSSPPLLDLLTTALLNAGARAATRGEFTLRAFLAGKLDLPQAEAVLGIIDADNRDDLKQALAQRAGGVTQPLHALRSDLLDLLADVEAGLDFTEEDIRFVDSTELLGRMAKGLALVTIVQKQLEQRSLSPRPFRAVLVGRPNAGKSSLFNALIGDGNALVSPQPGTTRDYLTRSIQLGSTIVELVDTAGLRPAEDAIETEAQHLGSREAEEADLLLLCLEGGNTLKADEAELVRRHGPSVILVGTKSDQMPAPAGRLATSAVTGAGLAELLRLLEERAHARVSATLAPSLSRCRYHVDTCLRHLRQAHAIVLYEDPPELLALELRGALDELGAMVGAVYTEDLLDRIFSRFCIGK
jgi:tRNA modification GTPase